MRATRLEIGLLVAVAALALAGCGGAQSRYASHLRRGQDYLAAGNLDKAGIEFRNAAQIQPKESDPLYYNGRVAEARGNVREAVSYYRAAVDANPNASAARARLGKLFVFAGMPQRALETVTPALEKNADDADLLAVKAASEHALKKPDEARADAEHALRVAPQNENAIAVLAAIHAGSKDYDKAIALVSGAVDRAPGSIDLREVLANLYLATAQPEKAEDQMRRIIELKPTDLSLRSQLAAHFARAHKLDAAQQVLEGAVAVFGGGKDKANANAAKLLLVDFISTQRSRADGEKELRRFIDADPGNLDLRLGLAALFERTGAAEDAVAAYQDVVRRDGTGAKGLAARNRIAAISIERGQLDQARKLVAEVLNTNPRDDSALSLRANIALQDGKPADAITDLRAVLHDQPNSLPLQGLLASAYATKGDNALAEETLRAAMQAAPEDVPIRIQLAQFLGQTGRADQSVTLLEETVKRAPDNLPAREALVRAYVADRKMEQASAAAEELKVQRPQWAGGYYLAGMIAAQSKDLEASEKDFERALELRPGDLEVLSTLSRVDFARGRPDQAVRRVQAAVSSDPNNAGLLNLLGGLLLERKDLDGADEAFARAAKLNPGLWQAHRNLAVVRVARNDSAAAIQQYQIALSSAPAEAQLVQEAASYFESQKRIDAALAAYDGLYRKNARAQQFAANNLAMLLVTYETDRASLDRARDLTMGFASSQNSSLLDTLGWVRFKRGEYKDALDPLQRAIAAAPDSNVIRYHLAMDQLQLGLRDLARTNLESALSGAGAFAGADEARTALADLKARSG